MNFATVSFPLHHNANASTNETILLHDWRDSCSIMTRLRGEISKTHFLEEGKKIGGGRQPRGNTLLNLPDGPVLIQDVTTECRASDLPVNPNGLIIISLKREREEVNQSHLGPQDSMEMNLVPSASWFSTPHSLWARLPNSRNHYFFFISASPAD